MKLFVCFTHFHQKFLIAQHLLISISMIKVKLNPRSLKCVFLGYFPTQKGHKCFILQLRSFSLLWMSLSLSHNSVSPKLFFKEKARVWKIIFGTVRWYQDLLLILCVYYSHLLPYPQLKLTMKKFQLMISWVWGKRKQKLKSLMSCRCIPEDTSPRKIANLLIWT